MDLATSKNNKVVILYYTRLHHTEKLAHIIASGVIHEGLQVKLLDIKQAYNNMEELNESSAIIFGCPTYFGSVPATFKEFMDKTTSIWTKQIWRNKIAAAFTHSSSLSGDKLSTILQLAVFAAQHGMIWAGLDLLPSYIPTESESNLYALSEFSDNKSPIIMNKLGGWMGFISQSESTEGSSLFNGDLATAKYFGIRIAKVVKEFQNKEI